MKISNVAQIENNEPISQSYSGVTENCHWQSDTTKTQSYCLINQKGGVGKSSCCFHLAGAFASMGKRVLVIDVDPQGSVSQGFLGSSTVESLPQVTTVATLFEESAAFHDWNELIHKTPFERLHLCPANQCLAGYNHPNPEESGVAQYALRDFVESLNNYDIVLFDCPPNLYRCTWMALVAADWVIIPVNPEDFGTQGLRAVHQAVENARVLNPQLRRLGHLLTRTDGRLLIHKYYERRLRKLYGHMVLDNFMSELSSFKVAVANRKPVEFHAPDSRAARLTRSLCHEILDRTTVLTQKRRAA